MPRQPPRTLCLPELVSNPQTRADYVEANPPKHGPASSRPSSYESPYSRAPPSPTSTTNDADSHRASGATLASLTSPLTPTSTRTSLSVHNLPWNGDAPVRSSLLSLAGGGGEGKGWSLGNISLGGGDAASKKPRASWSTAFGNTKSWFGSSSAPEANEASTSAQKHSSQKEIKLSPSMIAASTSVPSSSARPVSSPYPSASDLPILSPTGSADATRPPRVGTGLRYYTERNPAPTQARVQIPDPVDVQDHDRPEPLPPPSSVPTPTLTTFNTTKALPVVPDVTVRATSPPALHLARLKDAAMLRGDDAGPLSPPPTPPVPERESNVPHIRVSSGEDL